MDSPLYFKDKFTDIQAWIDLLFLAQFKDSFFFVRGQKVVVKRGCLAVSTEKLSERWKWSRGKVIRFLNELEIEQQIEQQKSKLINCISIVNYDKYQTDCTADGTTDNTANRTTGSTTDGTHKKNVKKVKNDKNSNIGEKSIRFFPPTLEEIKNYCSERKNNVDADKFFNFYESKGWMVGKNKMKDWQAAIKNWEKSNKQSNQTTSNVNEIWQK